MSAIELLKKEELGKFHLHSNTSSSPAWISLISSIVGDVSSRSDGKMYPHTSCWMRSVRREMLLESESVQSDDRPSTKLGFESSLGAVKCSNLAQKRRFRKMKQLVQ